MCAPEPKVTSVQQKGVDYEEDAVNVEQKEILASTAEEGSTLPVYEDFEDTNWASSDSLSPDLGEGSTGAQPLCKCPR